MSAHPPRPSSPRPSAGRGFVAWVVLLLGLWWSVPALASTDYGCADLTVPGDDSTSLNCAEEGLGGSGTTTVYLDWDGDGHYADKACDCDTSILDDNGVEYSSSAGDDCDDEYDEINPDATEACDGYDDDCSGSADYSDASGDESDADGDGYLACSSFTDLSTGDGILGGEDCDDGDEDEFPGQTWYLDLDGDGYGTDATSTESCEQPEATSGEYVLLGGDCDETAEMGPSIHPGATEACNELDDDCDGDVDEGVTNTYYADTDGDGYGDPSNTTESCDLSAPSGYVTDDQDCDDTQASIHPGASEVCDGYDDDCDGSADFSDTTGDELDADNDGYVSCSPFTDLSSTDGFYGGDDCSDSDSGHHENYTCYTDADGDGYGDPSTAVDGCETCSARGLVDNGDDCDDTDGSVHDGSMRWYPDLDGDGYGDSSVSYDDAYPGCNPPAGYVSNNFDCDDTDPDINPDTYWYRDSDGDTYGDPLTPFPSQQCSQPSGYVNNDLDCDDTDGTFAFYTFYLDADGDTYGDPDETTTGCTLPSGYVENGDDCDDDDGSVNPGASEICDDIDNDCDGTIDEDDAVDAQTWYRDADGDGYGDALTTTVACDLPAGYADNDDDCDDTHADVNPGATEVCDDDDADEDCDGSSDDDDPSVDTSTFNTWYLDSDGDGYGDPDAATAAACNQPSGYVAEATDCNDSAADVHPGADEYCNSVDDDCDGTVDEDDAVDAQTWYQDLDGDGYGDDDETTTACLGNEPAGYVDVGGDCDDTDATSYPGATELCDGVDNDCNGLVDDDVAAATWYYDADGDGYGGTTFTYTGCSAPSAQWVANGEDCDDGSDLVYPGAEEHCDETDWDCDGETYDSDAVDASTYYWDNDGDGYGSDSSTITWCPQAVDELPEGYVDNDDDCDDFRASRNPETWWYPDLDGDGYGDADATTTDPDYPKVQTCEQPYSNYVANGEDCDDDDPDLNPDTAWYLDNDGDGYGNASERTFSCEQPSSHVRDNSDCDDTDPDVHPGADEYCNGVDDDCDGTTDEDDAVDAPTWYIDTDGDGYGSDGSTRVQCEQPSGFVGNAEDCDDTSSAINPDAAELCDGLDNDCDGEIDEDSADDALTWYLDADSDGYGDLAAASAGEGDTNEEGTPLLATACYQPSGYVAEATDCDDTDPDVHPDADEYCNGVDDDCDGTTDEDDAVDAPTWYLDADGDGYGDPASPKQACEVPSGYVGDGTDCDDTRDDVNPGEAETWYDNVDEDCDGHYDFDADYDGYTGSIVGGPDCWDDPRDPPWTLFSDVTYDTADPWADTGELGDTADTAEPTGLEWGWDGGWTGPVASDVHPDAEETWYDGVDQDCDGLSDFDADGDGYDSADYVVGGVPGTDCNDDDPDVNTGAAEIWYDGVDQDCDGWSDFDQDRDGYDDAEFGGTDCVDNDEELAELDPYDQNGYTPEQINPDAEDACEPYGHPQIDNDCDGNPNTNHGEYVSNDWGAVYYYDEDGDGFADINKAYALCEPEDGFYTSFGDCDDSDPDAYPGAEESCNNKDDDCDGRVDESAPGEGPHGCITMYADKDGDGFGSIEDELCLCDSSNVCNPDSVTSEYYVNEDGQGYCYVSIAEGEEPDCNDEDPDIHPRYEWYELLDGADDDCSGTIPIVELDCDADGSFALLPGNPAFMDPISSPASLGLQDCRAVQIENPMISCWGETYDVTCDEETGLWTLDLSLAEDHFQDAEILSQVGSSCETTGDCDDQCAERCPGLTETCDGLDNDCAGASALLEADTDGIPDSMDPELPRWGYVSESEMDLDGDGYITCTDVPTDNQIYLSSASCADAITEDLYGDCNDLCAAVNPNAEEYCDGFLDLCGGEGEGQDADRDGFHACGAFSGSDDLPEHVYLLVWVNSEVAEYPETGETGETGGEPAETGHADTSHAHETGSAGDSGGSSTGDSGGSSTGDSGHAAADTGSGSRSPLPPARVEAVDFEPVDIGLLDFVPLLYPRPQAPDCDRLLATELSYLLDPDSLAAVEDPEQPDFGPLLDYCIRSDECRKQEEELDPSEVDPDCENYPGVCTVVRITLDESADEDLLDRAEENLDYDGADACLAHPEQLITRSVWTRERILFARELVANWECYRLWGTWGCDLEAPEGWDSPYGEVVAPGGHFRNADASRVLSTEKRWWLEVGRYDPGSPGTGILAGCWEDDVRTSLAENAPPSRPVNLDYTGGDCSDSEGLANRDEAEGPGDLLGIFFGTPADCSTCLDGIDNNCNGLTDCAEPACAECFVGRGLGCGGGDDAPCASMGCAAARGSRLPSTGIALALLGLLGLAYRWRDRR